MHRNPESSSAPAVPWAKLGLLVMDSDGLWLMSALMISSSAECSQAPSRSVAAHLFGPQGDPFGILNWMVISRCLQILILSHET